MSYTKNIAIIRGLKSGFSADGGALSGLVKAEKYGSKLKVEISYINFAPLTEGKYVCALSDGKHTVIVDDGLFVGESAADTSAGFAALICYVRGEVLPIASAVCGNYRDIALGLKSEIEREENFKAVNAVRTDNPEKKKPEKSGKNRESANAADGAGAGADAVGTAVESSKNTSPVYEDEAIAEVNYYEYEKAYTDGGALRADKTEEKDGHKIYVDEAAFGAVAQGQGGLEKNGEKPEKATYIGGKREKTVENPLAGGGLFYERMKDEIDGILSKYPAEKTLEEMIDESKWVRITYGEGGFYVFGVLFTGGAPKYICYGVPTAQSKTPPESMEGLASFLPASPDSEEKGYWVMYQDAETGASIKVNMF